MKKNNALPILILPGFLLIFVILIVPLAYTAISSLYSLKYLEFGNFVGLDNYIKILSDKDIIMSIIRTLMITLASLSISMIIGMVLALWIDKQKGFFAYIMQIVGLIPWVTSMVVSAILWRWIFNGDMGLFSYLLRVFRLETINIFDNAKSAQWALIVLMAWRTIGYSMVMILAGLKSIPLELVEAARVDGANARKLFLHIKLPLLKTPISISMVVLALSNFNNVTTPLIFTGGGPGEATTVVTLELYRQGFTYYNFGSASALSFILIFINLIMVVSYVRMVKYNV